jgi:hypothetical protein
LTKQLELQVLQVVAVIALLLLLFTDYRTRRCITRSEMRDLSAGQVITLRVLTSRVKRRLRLLVLLLLLLPF